MWTIFAYANVRRKWRIGRMVDVASTGQDGVTAQIELYGEPLSARFGRLLATFHIPQSRLAAVIGLSAPMLSQLASGQRVKISNPSVYARLLRLEEQAASPQVRSGTQAALQAALDEVAASRPVLTTGRTDIASVDASARDVAIAQLMAVGSADQLRAAAAAGGAELAELLGEAAARRAAADHHPVVSP